jgi:hypothetical protein
VHPFAVQSEIGRSRSTSMIDGICREIYPENYRPGSSLAEHLTFAFKHEGVHLEFLTRLYQRQGVRAALEQWISDEPTGAYARRAGFFYEWLLPEPLSFAGVTRGNYIDALDSERYLTGAPGKPACQVLNKSSGAARGFRPCSVS